MKTGMKLLLGAAALSLAGCATPTSVRVSQLEARIRALENRQNLQLARTEVLIRAAEQSEADGILPGLKSLEKGFEQQPPQQ